jgi:hypothetical protein
MLSKTMASHVRSANAWSSSRFMLGALPRWATPGTGDNRRRHGDWTCSSASRQSMPSRSHTVRGLSRRARPITRSVAPASRAASINPLE